jgi:hypothetical protein
VRELRKERIANLLDNTDYKGSKVSMVGTTCACNREYKFEYRSAASGEGLSRITVVSSELKG